MQACVKGTNATSYPTTLITLLWKTPRTIHPGTSSGWKGPNSPQKSTDSLELRRVDPVTRSHQLKLVVSAGIHHLPNGPIMRGFAELSGRGVEHPARSELGHHVCIYEGVPSSERRQTVDGKATVPRSADGEEHVGPLAELLQRRPCGSTFLQLLTQSLFVPCRWCLAWQAQEVVPMPQ